MRLVSILLFLLGVFAAGAEPARVALVSTESGDTVENVLALAQARLSADGKLTVLERNEVHRVLTEQKLSLAGVLEASTAVAAGKLVSADLFGVLESAPGSGGKAVGFVVFDAQSGARYHDTALPAEAGAAAEAIAAGVQSAVAKRQQVGHGLRAVGFVAARNADLPRSYDAFSENVALLLERGLPSSPTIAVLERRRLEQVNRERELPGAAAPSGLLASLVSIDLEISRGSSGRGIKATAHLKTSGRDVAWSESVEIEDSSAPRLAELLAKKLISSLQAAPAGVAMDPRAEARRFVIEATHRHAHGDFAGAARAVDTAYALDSTTEEIAGRAAFFLIRHCVWLFSPEEVNVGNKGGADAWEDVRLEPRALELLLVEAERAIGISSALLQRAPRNPWGHLHEFEYPLTALCHRFRGARVHATPDGKAQIDGFMALCRERSINLIEAAAARGEANPAQLDDYSATFHAEVENLKAACVDSLQYAGEIKRLTTRWLNATRNAAPKHFTWNGGEGINMLLGAITNDRQSRWTWWVDERSYAEQMEPVFAGMQEHARVVVRLYGLLGKIRADVSLGRSSPAAAQARFAAEYRPLAEATITTPEPWHAERTRDEVYEAWRAAIGEMPGGKPAFMAAEFSHMAEFLLKRGELRYKLVTSILEALPPAQALAMAPRMSAIVETAALDDAATRNLIKSHLDTVEQGIRIKHPELVVAAAPRLPWTSARKIFDAANLRPISSLVKPILHDDCAFTFGFASDGPSLRLHLLKIPLNGGEAGMLSAMEIPPAAKKLSQWDRNRFVTAACAADGVVYAGTRGFGIFAFPVGGGEARKIDSRAGLPSDQVSSIASLGGKLYVGFEDGYVACFDTQSGKCDILASSRRREKRSPVDDREVFRVPMLVADPARGRIVLLIGASLWQIATSGHQWKDILGVRTAQKDRSEPKLDGESLVWAGPVHESRVMLSTPFRAVEIDLAQDAVTQLHSGDEGVFPFWPPHLHVGNTIWSADYFASLSLAERRQTRFPPFGGSREPFRPSQGLMMLPGGKHVLLADEQSVWQLELAEQ
jgi:hypothetical protein